MSRRECLYTKIWDSNYSAGQHVNFVYFQKREQFLCLTSYFFRFGGTVWDKLGQLVLKANLIEGGNGEPDNILKNRFICN